jgi:hypothetical protein
MAIIIDRLARSLRTQNWLALGLEFVIVVFGIFVGLQVDDWNNRRIMLRSEAGYLERLSREVDNNLKIYRETAQWMELSEAALRLYYQSLVGEDAERPTDEVLLGMFCTPGFVSPVSYDNSVLEEMLNSGLLARLQDPSLRKVLAEYRAQQNGWDQLLADSSDDFKSTFRFIDRFRQWRPATEEEGFANCVIDFEALESHERAASQIANYQRHRFWQQINHAEIANLLEQVRTLLPPVN